MKILFLILFSFISLGSHAEELFTPIKPFTSDECSKWPEGNILDKDLWKECCYEHDLAYWLGGTRKERRKADEDLMKCVAKEGDPLNGALMWVGTRVGGRPYYPTPFRWGYGWSHERAYSPLNEKEIDSAKQELSNVNDEIALKAAEKYFSKLKPI